MTAAKCFAAVACHGRASMEAKESDYPWTLVALVADLRCLGCIWIKTTRTRKIIKKLTFHASTSTN